MPLEGTAALEVTVGMERGFASRPGADETLRRLAAAGVTSVETYVRWIDFEPRAGLWDWSVFDADLEALGRQGLRWVPFLIAGPWYATPEWFRAGPRSVFARCLEHGRETGAQSIWSPHLPAEVRRLLGGFRDRYGAAARPDGAISSLLLGIAGDYGEAIQSVVGNWPGDYHGHPGYWCADPHAVAAYRGFLRARHGSLRALGEAWGIRAPASWEGVRPACDGAPARGEAPPARWLEFLAWYRGAMTDWAARWLQEARRVLPEAEIYLCTGGDMAPPHGSDLSEQCRVAAAAGAGVRITNEGSDPVANLMLTRLVASACRRHGTFCGFEPAAAVTPAGIAARQWNATTSGARQLHEYEGNLREPAAAAAWERGRPWLLARRPRLEVALLHSLPDLAAREAGLLGGALALARALRPACDFEVLDDHLVEAGALDRMRAVFLAPARWWLPGTAERLCAFVAAGGICVAGPVRPAVASPPGADALEALFGFAPDTEELAGISSVRPVAGSPLAAADAAYGTGPALHMARAFDRLAPEAVPLLRLAHTPRSGRPPLVMWHRPHGRGTAVFFAGPFAEGDDWMAARGAGAALVRDILERLPADLGLPPVAVAPVPGVLETWVEQDGGTAVLGWNATDQSLTWRGEELGPRAIGRRAGGPEA